MPSRFVIRNFIEDGIYHIYNGGGNGKLFKDDQDFKVFLSYLLVYASPKNWVKKRYPDLPSRLKKKNLGKEVRIIGYCLMPDHYHLLVKQTTKDGISKMMKQISNAYTAFYNQKYNSSGSVFRGRYKAVLIEDNDLVLQLWRYIHLNPVLEKLSNNLIDYEWSSYRYFVGEDGDFKTDAVFIDNNFNDKKEIESFHGGVGLDSSNFSEIKDYTIEEVK